MAIGSVSGFGTRPFSPAWALLPRVGYVTTRPRQGAPSTERDRSGDRALGPRVQLFDAVGSALPTQQSFQRLLAFSEQLFRRPFGSLGRYEASLGGLSRLEQTTKALEREVGRLLDGDTLNANRATADTPAVRARATSRTETGLYPLRVLQPARGHRIASDPQADPLAPLGLEGTLELEGEAVQLALQNTLVELAEAINEAFEGAGVSVRATIDAQNRLVLERTPAGPQPIQIHQEGSVATALGLLRVDEIGDLSVAHELVAPQGAIVDAAGDRKTFETNRITGLFPELELELLPELFPLVQDPFGAAFEQPLGVTVQVSRDIERPQQAIFRFVEAYNRALQAFNEELLFPGSLEGDRSLGAARARLIRAVEEPVPGEEETAGTVEDIGLEVRRARESEVSELTLRRLALLDAFGQPPSPLASAGGVASVIRSLGRIGLYQADDGTLQVDRARLEQSLREEPALVGEILRENEQSVLPRLSEQLSRMRDTETGILARRRRLFETLQEAGRRALADTRQADSRRNLQALTEETTSQLNQLQLLLGDF